MQLTAPDCLLADSAFLRIQFGFGADVEIEAEVASEARWTELGAQLELEEWQVHMGLATVANAVTAVVAGS